MTRKEMERAFVAFIASALISGSAVAEEKEDSFSDALHRQIFHELKGNVEHLYKNTRNLLWAVKPAPEIDRSEISRSPVRNGAKLLLADRARN